jgi:hypothetical protein
MSFAVRAVLVSTFVLMAPRLGAQGSAATSEPPPAAPNDVKSADAIIKALYDANSTMVDQKRDVDRFRSLFASNGRMISTNRGSGGTVMVTRGIDQYVVVATAGKPRGGFSEREIARTSEAFGSIMQVFSTYEARRDSSDTHPTRGINSIQLFNDGRRWWVVTVLWDNERPNSPIPAVYLKSGPNPP